VIFENNYSSFIMNKTRLAVFWTSFKISRSVNHVYLKLYRSNRDMVYMVGKVKKFSTYCIQTPFTDSKSSIIKTVVNQVLLWFSVFADTADYNGHISQTRTDNKVILVEDERYVSLVIPTKIL